MKWTISQLKKYQDQDFQFDQFVDFSTLIELSSELIAITPVHVVGSAIVETAQINFQLKITGEMTLPCARTLVEVSYPFDIETNESFLLDKRFASSEFNVITGDEVDLYPVIQEILLLEIPLQVFADEESQRQGAPASGQGWELVLEDQQKEKIDPRFAKLAELFKEDK